MRKFHPLSAHPDTICVKTQIAFLRNVATIPFLPRLAKNKAESLATRWTAVLQTCYPFEDVTHTLSGHPTPYFSEANISIPKRSAAYRVLKLTTPIQGEHHTIWCELLEKEHFKFSMFVNEACAEPCMTFLEDLVDTVGRKFRFAYHAQFGYLTADTDSIGTGFRIRSQLHLTGLTTQNHLNALKNFAHSCAVQELSDLTHGNIPGNLFLFQNLKTLCETPQQIVQNFFAFLHRVARQEMRMRMCLAYDFSGVFYETLSRMRLFARHAHLITEEEAFNLLSDYWLGYSCGILSPIADEVFRLSECFDFAYGDMREEDVIRTPTEEKAYHDFPAIYRMADQEEIRREDVLRALWLRKLSRTTFNKAFLKRIHPPCSND